MYLAAHLLLNIVASHTFTAHHYSAKSCKPNYVKKSFISLFLFIASMHCFCQQQFTLQDSIAATYDLFNDKPFAEIHLEDTSGQLFNTAALKGKTLYVDFWFTACAPCIKEIPFAKELQQYFAADTNVVFLSICIENLNRKPVWKQLIKDKALPRIHLFYARNKPQKINLLTEYKITFPTYLLVNNGMKVIGYDAPRPSEKGWVHWAIQQAEKNISLGETFRQAIKEHRNFEDM